jgi:PAS domain S-box-containing protein
MHDTQLLNILVVEDNPADLFVLEGLLWKTRLPIEKISKAASGAEAVAMLQRQKPSLILLDLSLSDSTGIDSYKGIQFFAADIPILILTGLADMDMALETMSQGAQDYLVKGEFDEKLLAKSIQYSIERKKNLQKLFLSEQRFKSLVQSGSDMIKVLDANGIFIYISPTVEKVLGLKDTDLLGKSAFDFIHPDDIGIATETFRKVQFVDQAALPAFRFKNVYGDYRWLETNLTNLLNDESVQGIVSNSRDITARKEAAEIVRLSEERYRNLFFFNPMALYIWDLQTQEIMEVNGVAEREYGYTRDEFLKITIWDMRPPSAYGKLKKFIQKITEDNEPRSGGIWEHVNKKNEILYMEVSSLRIRYNNKDAVMAIANNITERIQLEKKLDEERKLKQKEITEAVVHAQEKERHDISRELHDNVNQQLTVAMMYIASAEKKNEGGAELLRQSADFILHGIEEIRRLTKGLVTPLIKDFGLIKAIESLLEDVKYVQDLHIHFVSDTFFDEDLEYDFKLSIFRIIQEQLSNVLKHADANSLIIELGRNMHSIYLSITDNGKGFDLAHQKKGIGLYNITSRVELFNGSISIHTAPTSGCAIHISFPIIVSERPSISA